MVCKDPREGHEDAPCSGLVQGLRERDIPVRVLELFSPNNDIYDMALSTSDQVVVAHWRLVCGLERKVVVIAGSWGGLDRLFAASRCTSQLVWIDAP